MNFAPAIRAGQGLQQLAISIGEWEKNEVWLCQLDKDLLRS
jgi:hypothetical protein